MKSYSLKNRRGANGLRPPTTPRNQREPGHSLDETIRRKAISQAKSGGAVSSFRSGLHELVFSYLREEVTPERKRQLSLEIERLSEGAKNIAEKIKDTKRKVIVGLRQKIDDLRGEIKALQQGTMSTVSDIDPLYLRCIGVLLVCLSIYVGCFYSSAGYSAYLWNPEAILIHDLSGGTNPANALPTVFDPRSLEHAFREGFGAVMFTIGLFCAFLAFAVFLHRFLHHPNRKIRVWGTAALGLIVLVYDGVLAALIDKKLHRAGEYIGQVKEPWHFSPYDAEFLSVLFGGFVITILWGFLFDHFFKLREANSPIRSRLKQIKDVEKEIKNREGEVEQLREERTRHLNGIERLQGEIDGKYFSLNFVKGKVNLFAATWMEYIQTSTLPHKDLLIVDIERAKDTFLAEIESSFVDRSGQVEV